MDDNLLGYSKSDWQEWNDIVNMYADCDPTFRALKPNDKAYSIAISTGWPIANGHAAFINNTEDGLKQIAKGAIIIANGKYFNIPLPRHIRLQLNTLYSINQ